MYRDSETGIVFHRGFILRSRFVVRLIQLVKFLFAVLYTLFAIRFALVYMQAAHVRFSTLIGQATDVFFRPFAGLVANGRDPAGHPVAWSILVAIGAYLMLEVTVIALLRTSARAPVERY
jgi:hypothetical protein